MMVATKLALRLLEALTGQYRKRTIKAIRAKRRGLLVENLEQRQLFAVLSPGDIAFTGYNGTSTVERVSFVVLRDIPDDGTVVQFTDNASNANGAYNTNEGLTTVTFTSAVTAGTRFYLEGVALKNFDGSAGPATVTGTAVSLSNTGDQVSAFQGTSAVPTNIASVSSFSYLTTGAVNNSTSYLPAGLTLGTNAIALGTGNFNGVLNSGDPDIGTAVTGSKAAILSKVSDIANWTASTSTTLVVPPAITFSVTNNSPTLSIAATSATQTEGQSGTKAFTFTVTRTVNTTGTDTVNYAVTGGTTNPAGAADFGGTLPSGTLTFNPGDTTQTITINVSGDTEVEPNESFVVTLSSPSSPAVIGTATANGTIQNDDSSFSIAALSASKLEGNSGTTSFTFTATRAGDTTTAASVDYTATGSGANPTDAADFSGAVTGTALFAIGAATATVTINVAGDTTPESDETFDVTLSNAVGSGAISAIVGTPASATGTILNDDAATTIAIAATDATKAEGNTGTTSFTFTVTRSGVTTGTSSATWTVTGSGANPANTTTDLTAPTTGTISFAENETSQVITVLVTGDTTIEPNEGFTVTLSAPSSGTAISTGTADGSIVNDDLSISLPTTATSTTEGNSGSTPVSVTVTRTGDTSVSTTVDWAVTGSGTNAANAADFAGSVFPSGTVTFAMGETTQTINFNIQGDTTVELDETFTLTLSNASGGAVIGTATQGGTIVTDDVFALAAGDIAFTGYNGTTTTERVSFVVLRDLPSLTGLNFTDNGASSNGAFNSNEGLTSVIFTSPVTAGARFYLEGLALKNFDGSDAAATVTGSPTSLANSGDQVTAFQGPIGAPTAVIASISSGSFLTTGSINNSTSYLPTGLTLGATAISLGGLAFNGVLSSSDPDIGSTVTGPKSSILSRVNDIANWTASSATTLVVPPAIAFSVGLTTPTVTATPATKVYDGSAIAIAATADDGAGGLAADTTAGNFTYIYYAGPNLTGGTIANAPINVGSYSVEIVYAGNENYSPVASTTFNFTITARPVNVTANIQTKVYGVTDPVLTYSIGAEANTGLVGGDVLTGALTRDAGTNVGSYAITQGSLAAPNNNYTVNYVGANFSITAATLTITADAKSKTYGGTDPALTYTPSGLTNGDTSAVITGSLARATGENVGTYAITQGSVAAGSNYTINYVGANLSITAATLTITADAKSKTYGGADPALTYTPSGLTNGDTAAVITGSLARATGENVGTYAITQGSVAAGSNYTINYVGANLSVTAATLTITADAKSKTYGGTDPALTYTPSGLTNGDTAAVITGSLARATGENVGTYAITQGSVAAGSNYTINYVGANLSVTAATLTITADAKSKTVGDADPALTYTFSGLTNGDTSAVITGSLSRTAGETAGVYPINLGSIDAGSNYSITFVGANLTINPAAAAPTFSGALVNGSDTFLNAAQRSQVTSLVLNFSAPVVIASGAFTVENIGLITAQSAVALASSQILVTGSGTSTITLRWGAGSGVVTRGASGATGNSLADGNWRLTIDSTKVTAQSGGAQLTGSNTFGATSADNFFRMFGDNDGDGDVDGIDLIAARRAALLAPSVSNPYNAAMDSNGDGINFGQGIDSAFTSNYGKRRRSF